MRVAVRSILSTVHDEVAASQLLCQHLGNRHPLSRRKPSTRPFQTQNDESAGKKWSVGNVPKSDVEETFLDSVSFVTGHRRFKKSKEPNERAAPGGSSKRKAHVAEPALPRRTLDTATRGPACGVSRVSNDARLDERSACVRAPVSRAAPPRDPTNAPDVRANAGRFRVRGGSRPHRGDRDRRGRGHDHDDPRIGGLGGLGRERVRLRRRRR